MGFIVTIEVSSDFEVAEVRESVHGGVIDILVVARESEV